MQTLLHWKPPHPLPERHVPGIATFEKRPLYSGGYTTFRFRIDSSLLARPHEPASRLCPGSVGQGQEVVVEEPPRLLKKCVRSRS